MSHIGASGIRSVPQTRSSPPPGGGAAASRAADSRRWAPAMIRPEWFNATASIASALLAIALTLGPTARIPRHAGRPAGQRRGGAERGSSHCRAGGIEHPAEMGHLGREGIDVVGATQEPARGRR